jgi:hypothetical protein
MLEAACVLPRVFRAQFLKIDSCCGAGDHPTAFSDYSKFRDAMNASGEPV